MISRLSRIMTQPLPLSMSRSSKKFFDNISSKSPFDFEFYGARTVIDTFPSFRSLNILSSEHDKYDLTSSIRTVEIFKFDSGQACNWLFELCNVPLDLIDEGDMVNFKLVDGKELTLFMVQKAPSLNKVRVIPTSYSVDLTDLEINALRELIHKQ